MNPKIKKKQKLTLSGLEKRLRGAEAQIVDLQRQICYLPPDDMRYVNWRPDSPSIEPDHLKLTCQAYPAQSTKPIVIE